MDWIDDVLSRVSQNGKWEEVERSYIEAVEYMIAMGLPVRGAVLMILAQVELMGYDSLPLEAMSREVWGEDFRGEVSV